MPSVDAVRALGTVTAMPPIAGLLPVIDVTFDEASMGLVLPYPPGPTLSGLADRGILSMERLLRIGTVLARTLSALHGAGFRAIGLAANVIFVAPTGEIMVPATACRHGGDRSVEEDVDALLDVLRRCWRGPGELYARVPVPSDGNALIKALTSLLQYASDVTPLELAPLPFAASPPSRPQRHPVAVVASAIAAAMGLALTVVGPGSLIPRAPPVALPVLRASPDSKQEARRTSASIVTVRTDPVSRHQVDTRSAARPAPPTDAPVAWCEATSAPDSASVPVPTGRAGVVPAKRAEPRSSVAGGARRVARPVAPAPPAPERAAAVVDKPVPAVGRLVDVWPDGPESMPPMSQSAAPDVDAVEMGFDVGVSCRVVRSEPPPPPSSPNTLPSGSPVEPDSSR